MLRSLFPPGSDFLVQRNNEAREQFSLFLGIERQGPFKPKDYRY